MDEPNERAGAREGADATGADPEGGCLQGPDRPLPPANWQIFWKRIDMEGRILHGLPGAVNDFPYQF